MNEVEAIIPILQNWRKKKSYTQGELIREATEILQKLLTGIKGTNIYNVNISYNDVDDRTTHLPLLHVIDCLSKYGEVVVCNDAMNYNFVVSFR